MAKLDMFKAGGGAPGGRAGGGQGEAVASLMKKYQDLKEEYRLYRKKAMLAIQVGLAGRPLARHARTHARPILVFSFSFLSFVIIACASPLYLKKYHMFRVVLSCLKVSCFRAYVRALS